ncbi:O-antigen polymerase [Vibrio alginolyticus]|nr:oligosaccharide repeat unit polymerase [Vibrio alginolyticus]
MTDIIIILLSIPPLLISFNYIIKGVLSSAVVIYPVFFIFYVSPSFLNTLYGVPNYSAKFENFRIANDDHLTAIIYSSFVCLILIYFTYKLLSSKKANLIRSNSIGNPVVNKLLLFFSFSGIALVFFSPNPEVYFNYGDIRGMYGTEDYLFYAHVSFACVISAFCVLMLRFFYGKNINSIKGIVLVIILILDAFFNGKRLLMFFIPVYFMIGYFFSNNKWLEAIKVLLSLIIFVTFYNVYTDEIKFKNLNYKSEEEIYEGLRIDFGRDDVLKYSIYKNIVVGESIVEYPGQTILGTLVAYLPRSFFPNEEMKPYPYAQYLTNSLVYNQSGAGLRGWTVTTSFIDEFISNFGILGFLLVILFYNKCFNYIDKLDSQNYRFFFYIIFAFLHVIHPHGFMPLVYIGIFMIVKLHFKSYRFRAN